MNLKVGQKYRVISIQNGNSALLGLLITITTSTPSSFGFLEAGRVYGCHESSLFTPSLYTFEEINPPSTPMPQTDDIPKTLSIMERIKETPDRKTLIKAGYIAAGEYTQKAKDLAIILFLETQTTKLVELATEELAETKEE